MGNSLETPGVVPGCPFTARAITRAGTRAWQRRDSWRLVSGLFLLLALFAPSAFAAEGVLRLEWARSTESDVAFYLVERETATGWSEVARVRNAEDEARFNPATGHFALEVPEVDPGRWRLTAVDAVGNLGRPTLIAPEASAAPTTRCTWTVAGHHVPVICASVCTCEVVTRRLDEARDELRASGVLERPELLDQALALTTVELVGPERLVYGGQLAAGAAREGSVLLASDLRAAAHEFMHLYLLAKGDRDHGHRPWEQDQRLRDIDRRHGVGGWQR